MSKNLPAAGTHPAKLAGPIVVNESENTGALCAYIPVTLLSDVPWTGKHTITMVKSDGTPMTKNIETLRQLFKWETANFFDLEDMAIDAIEFDAVGEHEPYTPEGGEEVMVFKLKWLNPPGGGGAKMPERVADRKTLLTKYGAKFKALAPVAKPAAKPAAAAPVQSEMPTAPAPAAKAVTKPAAGGPPSRPKSPPAKPAAAPVAARVATQEEVWAAYDNANPSADPEVLGTQYWAAVEEIAPGKDGNLTPEEWGQVATKLAV